MFARDSANVREWMRHAVEAQLADAVVVSSAAALAVRFLQRRYRYPALSWAQSTGGVNSGTDGTVRRRGRGSRRRRAASAGVLSELLAVACLHLASKYHCVEALEARAFGSPVRMSRVFSLGESINKASRRTKKTTHAHLQRSVSASGARRRPGSFGGPVNDGRAVGRERHMDAWAKGCPLIALGAKGKT